MPTLLDNLISQYQELYNYLMDNGQVTLAINVETHYRKVFLLSCASYYESEIQKIIRNFVSQNSTDERVSQFLVNKAISRQYHTYFSWDGKNINSFLGLFGSEFKERIAAEVKENPELSEDIQAFLTMGNERNKMVHENFLAYPLDKTFAELEVLNKRALRAIVYIRKIFA